MEEKIKFGESDSEEHELPPIANSDQEDMFGVSNRDTSQQFQSTGNKDEQKDEDISDETKKDSINRTAPCNVYLVDYEKFKRTKQVKPIFLFFSTPDGTQDTEQEVGGSKRVIILLYFEKYFEIKENLTYPINEYFQGCKIDYIKLRCTTYKEYNEDTDFWNNKEIKICRNHQHTYNLEGLTLSNMLQYFSTAQEIIFFNVCFDNLEEFTINEAQYSINLIEFNYCTYFKDETNIKTFDLINKIATHKLIQSSLKWMNFNSDACISYQKWESTYKNLDLLEISLKMYGSDGFIGYEKEMRKFDFEGEPKYFKIIEDPKEESNSNTKRHQARVQYLQLYQSLLKHRLKGYYCNYMTQALKLTSEQEKFRYLIYYDFGKEFKKEVDLWCYEQKVILDKIEIENLEELSQWDDNSDQTSIKDKSLIDKMIEKYKNDNTHICQYLQEVPLAELTDAYTKSKTYRYEPGYQRDTGTLIFNMLKKVIQNQNLEEEKGIAFFNFQTLDKGAYGEVNLITTNKVVVGEEVKIAVKSIFNNIQANNSTNNVKQKKEKDWKEFELLHSINHPNIMKAYFMWETSQNKLKIASEYLPCSDLNNILSKYKIVKKTRGLPLELVRFYAVEIIKALSYMRDNKILHRDIKPQNIMLDHNFHIKLVDFGLGIRYDENNISNSQSKMYNVCSIVKIQSKILLEEVDKIKENMKDKDCDDDSSSDSEIEVVSKSEAVSESLKNFLSTKSSRNALECGTMPYKAPELYILGAGSHEADVWAMGVMIYQLLVGQLPWESHKLSKMQTATFDYPEDFDEATKEFINGCLKIDPNKRTGCGESENFEEAMFNLEFFEGKIDTTTIHDLTPPVDPEVVNSINGEIKENNNEFFKTDNEQKFHKFQILHDGTAYEGEWRNNLWHGKGTLFKLSTDGTYVKIYEGEWREHMREGEGTEFKISANNKSVMTYKGQWVENMRHFKGIQYEISGDDIPVKVYQGDFNKNKCYGYGTQFKISANNKSVKVYDGEWNEGVYTRKGTFFDGTDLLTVECESNEHIFENCRYRRNNKADVNDCWVFNTRLENVFRTSLHIYDLKEEWTETWRQNFASVHFPCVIVEFSTGDLYVGEFNTEAKRNGKGVNFNQDGSIYVGEWVENEKHGPGTLYSNNESYQKDDNYIKKQINQCVKNEYDQLETRDLQEGAINWKHKMEDILKRQNQKEPEMEIDAQQSYKEEQQWEQEQLVNNLKAPLQQMDDNLISLQNFEESSKMPFKDKEASIDSSLQVNEEVKTPLQEKEESPKMLIKEKVESPATPFQVNEESSEMIIQNKRRKFKDTNAVDSIWKSSDAP